MKDSGRPSSGMREKTADMSRDTPIMSDLDTREDLCCTCELPPCLPLLAEVEGTSPAPALCATFVKKEPESRKLKPSRGYSQKSCDHRSVHYAKVSNFSSASS